MPRIMPLWFLLLTTGGHNHLSINSWTLFPITPYTELIAPTPVFYLSDYLRLTLSLAHCEVLFLTLLSVSVSLRCLLLTVDCLVCF